MKLRLLIFMKVCTQFLTELLLSGQKHKMKISDMETVRTEVNEKLIPLKSLKLYQDTDQ